MHTTPRVSIGMPVYNGELYLVKAMESLLAQDFGDFELIVSDNASTDATEDICRRFAAADNRIRYHRNDTNLGAAWNFNSLFKLARGKYFKWAAHDDVCEPEFIRKCVRVLEQDSSVVLCYPRTRIIGTRGQVLQDYNVRLNADAALPPDRVRAIIADHLCFEIFGLIRSSVLRKTRLIGNFISSDRALLIELALHGRFFEIPEYLFMRRAHRLS